MTDASVTDTAPPAAERSALDAIGRVLDAIGGSGVELQPVLERALTEAAALCHADMGFVFLLDGDVLRTVAGVGATAEHWDYQRAHPFPVTRETVGGRVALSNDAVHIADVLADEEYHWGGQAVGGYRTLLGVPIHTDAGLIGAFGLGRATVSPFSDAEIDLVSVFADQAAVAIRLARLLAETNEALERESAVGHVLGTIARSTFDLQAVLDGLIANAARLSHADEGNLLREEDGHWVVAAFTSGVTERFRDIVRSYPFRPERGSLMGRALEERAPVLVEDVLADPEYVLTDAQREAGFRTFLAVPLLRDGEPIGVLGVWRTRVEPFTEPEIRVLTTFADQAVLAFENVRLFQTVERQRAALASFAPHVADLLSRPDGEALLAGHRREISAMFCDMRGFTAFAETAEPEELFNVLREYHAAVGAIVLANGGTVEHFAGDGFMIFFNDPTPIADHPMAALRSAFAIRDRFAELADGWRKRGYELGLGIGMGVGYATLGRIGFEGRYDYAGVGAVANLASRLSSVAAADEILINQRMFAMVEDAVTAEPVEGLQLKGLTHAVTAYQVTALR